MPRATPRVDGLSLLDPSYAVFGEVPAMVLSDDRLDAARALMTRLTTGHTFSDHVGHVDHDIATPDGHTLRLRVYRPADADGPRPCVYGIHGGGYIGGTFDMLDSLFDGWCARLGVVGVSVDYRLAPEHPYPTPLEDCYTGLVWAYERCEDLGIDPMCVGVHGPSAGGGLAAALAILARDRGAVPLAFQVLECPMLDDRFVTPSSTLDALANWTREANEYGWRSYLGTQFGRDDLPGYAAAAREKDLTGLPPTIVCVGGADGFRDEDTLYAMRLGQAGVPTELHVYPGAPHGGHHLESAPASQQWLRDVEAWLGRQIARTRDFEGIPAAPRNVDGMTLLDPTFVEPISKVQLPVPELEGLVDRRDMMRSFFAWYAPSGAVRSRDHATLAPDGHEVALRVYRPDGVDGPLPCIYAIHGGGYIVGSYEMLDVVFEQWCPRLGVVGVSVEYRLAPEHPYPTPLDDCYAGLVWTFDHADELGIDATRIGIQGASAGGGLAAALALLNRDRDAVPLAFQALECPMLDDRFLTPSSNLDRLQIWSREANEFGWRSYLGDLYGRADVPHLAAPARAEDLANLPPTLVSVGGADGFRDEDVLYAMRLCEAGVPTELHVYPGAPHGAQLVPESNAAKQWARDIEGWLARQMGTVPSDR